MNKIVRDYPVDHLPFDLRDGLPEHGHVEIEFRASSQPATSRVKLADLAGSVPDLHGSAEEVLQYLRKGRDDR